MTNAELHISNEVEKGNVKQDPNQFPKDKICMQTNIIHQHAYRYSTKTNNPLSRETLIRIISTEEYRRQNK